MKAVLENKEDRFGHDYENDDPVFEFEKINLFTFYNNHGKYYVAHQISYQKNYAVVEEVKDFEDDPDNFDFESYLKCPYCKHENFDSFELEDSSDSYECGNCGSVISFERIIDITYSSKAVKTSPVVEV